MAIGDVRTGVLGRNVYVTATCASGGSVSGWLLLWLSGPGTAEPISAAVWVEGTGTATANFSFRAAGPMFASALMFNTLEGVDLYAADFRPISYIEPPEPVCLLGADNRAFQ